MRILKTRLELPSLLVELGLVTGGVEVGVQEGAHAEHILRHWPGTLWCVDPWRAYPPGIAADEACALRAAIDALERIEPEGDAEGSLANVATVTRHRAICEWLREIVAALPVSTGTDYIDLANDPQELHDAKYLLTIRRLFEWAKVARCHIWRMTGDEAVDIFADIVLDFVYLDARHDYRSVLADIQRWALKVKPGGIIAGHDYLDGDMTFDRVIAPDGTEQKIAPVKTVFGVKRAVDEIAKYMEWDVHVTTDDRFPTWYVQTPA